LQALGQDLGEVARASPVHVSHLRSAAEAVCDDWGGRTGGTQRGQQRQLGHGARHGLVAGFGAKTAGEAAAARELRSGVNTSGLEEAPVRVEAEDRLLMAVRLHHG
jgi:hypothetical protein